LNAAPAVLAMMERLFAAFADALCNDARASFSGALPIAERR
jgi:hypothetical protein